MPSTLNVRPGIPADSATAERVGKEVVACSIEALEPNLGASVLLDGERQAALFLVPGVPGASDDSDSSDGSPAPAGSVSSGATDEALVYALDNIDPFAGVAVMARGIVGEHEGTLTVASPLLKQRFSLESGQCLDDPEVSIVTYPVEIRDGHVVIGF